MSSRRTLGTVALVSLATAAISFAVVDVSTSLTRSCVDADSCVQEQVPAIAISFAALGVLALVIGVVPAILWIIASIQYTRQFSEQVEDEVAREHRRALHPDEDFAEAAPEPSDATDD